MLSRASLWTPLAAGADRRCCAPRAAVALGRGRSARCVTLGLAIGLVADFDTGAAASSTSSTSRWIPDLGVRYQLGVDGISVFLVLLTAVALVRGRPCGRRFATSRATGARASTTSCSGSAETATLGAFLAQDLLLFVLFFDLMLIPFFFLFGTFGGEQPGRGDDEDDRLHAGRLAADAGRRDRHRGARRRTGGELTFSIPVLREHLLAERHPGLDLLLLRRGLPGQDAGLPAPRLDARRLPRRAAAGAVAALRRCSPRSAPTASCGSCCRSIPDATVSLPGADHADRARLDPLRLGDGVHPDQRPPDRRLLVDRPARLHHARHLRPARRRRRRRGPADGQPRPRGRRRCS